VTIGGKQERSEGLSSAINLHIIIVKLNIGNHLDFYLIITVFFIDM